MGIANFLSEVLPRAGRPVDLKDFARSNSNNNNRKLRIGIDVEAKLLRRLAKNWTPNLSCSSPQHVHSTS